MDKVIDFKLYPTFDVKNRNGVTDYIDYLRWNEIDHSVMVGVDKFRRKFMVVKMLVNDDQKVMQTFFQRYTDGSGWMGCGHATSSNLIDTIGGMTNEQFVLIKNILTGSNISIKEEHRPTDIKFKNVRLYK